MNTDNKAIAKSAAVGVLCGMAGMALAWRMLGSASPSSSSGGGDAARCPMSGSQKSSGGGGGGSCPFAFMMGGGGGKNKGGGATCPMSGSGGGAVTIDLDAAIISAGGEVDCTCKSFTYEELSACTGDDDGDVCMAVKGVVYRLTRQFYGPGEPYSTYAGKDITIPLAISEVSDVLSNVTNWESYVQEGSGDSDAGADGGVKPPTAAFNGGDDSTTVATNKGANNNLSGPANLTREERLETLKITAEEMRILGLWETKFRRKYRVVGWVKEMQKEEGVAGGVHTFPDYLDMEKFVRLQAGQKE